MISRSVVAANTKGGLRATIMFTEPHLASLNFRDGQWMQELSRNAATDGERLLRVAIEQALIRPESGGIQLPGGLVDAVASVLASRGCDVHIDEGPYLISPRPTELAADIAQTKFVDVLESRTRILATARRSPDRVDLLRTICRRFAGASVGVAVPTNLDAARLAATLRSDVPQTVHTGMRCSPDNRPQLHLMAIGGFALPHVCSIAVAFGTSAAMSSRVLNIASCYEHAVRIALVDSSYSSRDIRDRVYVEALYGPCVYDADQVPRLEDTHAVILPAGAHPISQGGDALLRKKALYWRNASRNCRIAQLCRALQQGDATCLRPAGVIRFGDVAPELATPQKPCVAVLVESSQHARELQRYLPDWGVIADVRSMATFGIEGDGHIVTLPAAHAVGLSAEVIVYAAGTGDRWFDAWSGIASLSGGMQLVVDFADDFDVVSRADLARRVADYRARDWSIHWPGHGGKVVRTRSACRPAVR